MSEFKKIKVIEPGWPRYKLTVSITPIDKEVGATRISKEEFIFRAHEIGRRFWDAVNFLKSKFNSKSGKIWVIGHSLNDSQFGYVVKQHRDWMGYEVFFPNGLSERNDPHYRSFRQEFLTSCVENAIDYLKFAEKGMSPIEYVAKLKYYETCLIGDVEPYIGSSKLHWEVIAFGPPEDIK